MVNKVGSGFAGFIDEIKSFAKELIKSVSSAASKIFESRSSSEFEKTEAVNLTEKNVEIVVQRDAKSCKKALKILGGVDSNTFIVTPGFKKDIDDLHAHILSGRSRSKYVEAVVEEVFVDKRICLPATSKNIEDIETLQEISNFIQRPRESKQAFVDRINKRGKGISKGIKNKFKDYYRELKLKQPELTSLQAMSSFVDNVDWIVKS